MNETACRDYGQLPLTTGQLHLRNGVVCGVRARKAADEVRTELDDAPSEAMASVASLDAARSAGRSRSRVDLTTEVRSNTLMG